MKKIYWYIVADKDPNYVHIFFFWEKVNVDKTILHGIISDGCCKEFKKWMQVLPYVCDPKELLMFLTVIFDKGFGFAHEEYRSGRVGRDIQMVVDSNILEEKFSKLMGIMRKNFGDKGLKKIIENFSILGIRGYEELYLKTKIFNFN
ncbi:MAG: hypothetical protein GXP45_04440 [bacterium]|nr:hypothetical protein [bacterium]